MYVRRQFCRECHVSLRLQLDVVRLVTRFVLLSLKTPFLKWNELRYFILTSFILLSCVPRGNCEGERKSMKRCLSDRLKKDRIEEKKRKKRSLRKLAAVGINSGNTKTMCCASKSPLRNGPIDWPSGFYISNVLNRRMWSEKRPPEFFSPRPENGGTFPPKEFKHHRVFGSSPRVFLFSLSLTAAAVAAAPARAGGLHQTNINIA